MRHLTINEIESVAGGYGGFQEEEDPIATMPTVTVTSPPTPSVTPVWEEQGISFGEWVNQNVLDPNANAAAWDAIGAAQGLSGEVAEAMAGDFPITVDPSATEVDLTQEEIDALWAAALQDIGTGFVDVFTGLGGMLIWPDNGN